MQQDILPPIPDIPFVASNDPQMEPFPGEAFPGEPPPILEATSPFKRFWRKFGGDGFLVSVIFHAILILIILFWVISVHVMSPPNSNEFATGAGGGNNGEKISMQEHRLKQKNSRNMVKSAAKLTAKNVTSSIALPQMQNVVAAFDSGNSLTASSKGAGGGGGGGEGGGIGPGKGGGRNMVSLFGVGRKRANTLEGTLYDLKRNKDGKSLYNGDDRGPRIQEMKNAYLGFLKSKKQKDYFDGKYYSVPEKLYMTHMVIPEVDASIATKSFGCDDRVKAPGWLAYYEGWITPPETDSYRFAGMGDDGLLVVLDEREVLWAPWTQGGMQNWVKVQADWMPKEAYGPSGHLPGLGHNGRYYGSWMPLTKGKRYKMQIIIAEGYGGLFSASILVQQKSKHGEGMLDPATPLPAFMLDSITPEELEMKKGKKVPMRWSAEGPLFGLAKNGVQPPAFSSGRR